MSLPLPVNSTTPSASGVHPSIDGTAPNDLVFMLPLVLIGAAIIAGCLATVIILLRRRYCEPQSPSEGITYATPYPLDNTFCQSSFADPALRSIDIPPPYLSVIGDLDIRYNENLAAMKDNYDNQRHAQQQQQQQQQQRVVLDYDVIAIPAPPPYERSSSRTSNQNVPNCAPPP